MSVMKLRFPVLAGLILLGALLMANGQTASNDLDLAVYPDNEKPNDSRLGDLVTLNDHFPFKVPKSKEAWEERSAKLKRQVQVAVGLYPMPPKTELNPVLHGKFTRDGVTIEKVYFESMPGHFVTGLLFRPENPTGKCPAVLSPHGHGGRKAKATTSQLHEMIAAGQERFLESGQNPKVSRCVHLARMGCVCFLFDMLGYGDSVQLPFQLAHRFENLRPELENDQRWGLFTTQAELRLQSIMGIQTWNAIRGLDFLESLPDVDPQRMAVTGGSGGGTQTILVCALDDRPIAAFPQGMVSTSMQGGCICENCNLLRLGTGNVELAALFAPKPQAMTAADDWTIDMMEDGYPQLQKLYEMIGNKDDVYCKGFPNFPHNYNYVSRALMYRWFNKHLKLGLQDPVLEEDYPQLTDEEQAVWTDQHPAPPSGVEYETSLVKYMAERDFELIQKNSMASEEQWERFTTIAKTAFQTLIGRQRLPNVEIQFLSNDTAAGFDISKEIVRQIEYHEELPIVRLTPKKANNDRVVLWLSDQGKNGLLDSNNQLAPEVEKLLEAGFTVVGVDLLQQGEFLKPVADSPDADNAIDAAKETSDALAYNRTVDTRAQYAGYTFAYNSTLFASRVHDVLTTVSALTDGEAEIDMIAAGDIASVAAVARLLVRDTIKNAALVTDDFRFRKLTTYRDARFLPGAVKYGDMPAVLAAAAPSSVWIGSDSGESFEQVKFAYDRHKDSTLNIDSNGKLEAAVEWLVAKYRSQQ